MKDKPNIHLLTLYGKKFLYDVDTNSIISIPQRVYDFLLGICNTVNEKEREEKYKNASSQIKRDLLFLKQQGLLHPVNEKLQIRHMETDILKELYDGTFALMTLQVTQNCNLRCEYCVYSGSYVNRIHTNKRMSWETAKQAVDFYYQHTKNSKEVAIGFYGGEPLLEFELIRKVVLYAEELFIGKKISFNMTTNATLLTEKIVTFMLEHHFHIAISLDGPKKIQDGNRFFADKTRGTFDTVMKKLEQIKKCYPEFMKNVSFNAVIDLSKDVGCANDFFMSYETVKDTFVQGNMINSANRKEEVVVNKQFIVDGLYEEFKVLLYYCTNIFLQYHPTLMDGKVRGIKQIYYNRLIAHNAKTNQDCPGGQCLPGAQRFFVNADGIFYPCERVDEASDTFRIGSIKDGFDMKRISKLLNVAKLTENECRNCWCFRLCSQCIAVAEKDGDLSRTQRLENCAAMRRQTEEEMKDYIVLCDHNCDFDKEARG